MATSDDTDRPSLLRRLFPHPLLTILLVIVWLVIANSFTLNSLVLGTILGILIPFFTYPYWPNVPTGFRAGKMIAYIGLVIWDIIVANIAVAWIVMTKRNADMRSTWVTIPLDLRKPEAITVLAGTITLTPGTVSADLSDEGHSLLVHALDAESPEAVRYEIKERYERRLKEIFE
ncbi:multisubunit potassium/proton antiporter, PhaE subunit [Roseivivax lentus]|uniref:Multisubunit potassium/proton antiporter, PhaE subunit n=1 Tax=Roseivivax lentus TaxID=633194 RepID=A0A1N7KTZ5_9RHOB|nr:Na+/H+ antiporter subunit E [Roseivivax lentus]SIS65088.1 multisubunit potassium/proton antiporter, PhaE subunit [Roseivivax lentus]